MLAAAEDKNTKFQALLAVPVVLAAAAQGEIRKILAAVVHGLLPLLEQQTLAVEEAAGRITVVGLSLKLALLAAPASSF
jgi:hypothetical protein